MSALRQTFEGLSERARGWFSGLEPRERLMVVGCAVVLLVTVLFLGVWEPLTKTHAMRVDALERAQETRLRIDHAAQLARASQGRAAPGSGVSLLAAVDQSSKEGTIGKAPTRIQPQGEREVRVWFDDVPFEASLRWLERLQSHYAIEVQTLDIEPESTPGRVKLRASLARPS